MSARVSKKRTAVLRQRVKEMAEIKKRRQSDELAEGPSSESSSEVLLDSTLELPAPVDDVSSDEDSSDEDYDDTIVSEDSAAIYRDWIGEMSRVDKQRIAMILYDNYTTRFGLLKVPAAKEVALFLGICETTVMRWRKEFLTSSKQYGEDSRGKYVYKISSSNG